MIRRLFGLGPTKIESQLTLLKQYIVQNNVQLVEEDPKYRFRRCTDFAKEISSLPPLTNEYFLKVGVNKYAYLGNTSQLQFFPDHIGTQIGLNRMSQDYHKQLYNFLNNYLCIRVKPVRPLTTEERGLINAFTRDANNRVQRNNEVAHQNQLKAQQEAEAQPQPGETEHDHWLRMRHIEQKRQQEIFLAPANCAVNFRTYLDTPVVSEDFISMAYIGQKIFNILVASIGNDFEQKRRLKLNPSQINLIRNYAENANKEKLKEQFIDYLCTTPEYPEYSSHTKARVILERVYFPEYESSTQNEFQQSDPTTPNKLQALIWCLEYFEAFLLIQAHGTQTQTEGTQTQGTQTQGTQTQGGKSKSKSTRKKRFSHRKKKWHSHSHKHKHKRRAPNTKQY
jgi:hypothetical protein